MNEWPLERKKGRKKEERKKERKKKERKKKVGTRTGRWAKAQFGQLKISWKKCIFALLLLVYNASKKYLLQ